ncbi:hypothetical protein ACLOJK_037252, partial [Asimina triloba]
MIAVDMPQQIAADRSSSQQQIRNRHTHCLGWNTPRRPCEQIGTGDGSRPSARVREERGSRDGRRRRGSLTGVREKGLAYQGLGRGCRVTDLGREDDCRDSDLGREDDWKTMSVGKKDVNRVTEDGSQGRGDADGVTEMEKNDTDGVRWGEEGCRRRGGDGNRRRRRGRRREDTGDERLDAGGGRGASWEDGRENRGLG